MTNSKQAFFAMFGLAILLLIVAGFITSFGLGELKKKGSELTKLKTTQAVLEKRQADLVKAKQDIKKYEELEKISKAIVPQEKDQAVTVREIVAIAQQSGIPLESVQFPSSDLGAIKSKKPAKSKSKAKSSVDPNKTQLSEVPETTGLYAMEITVKSSTNHAVPYNKLLEFLERLEQNRRTAHVTNISINPSEDNRNLVTFTISLNVYIKPAKS